MCRATSSPAIRMPTASETRRLALLHRARQSRDAVDFVIPEDRCSRNGKPRRIAEQKRHAAEALHTLLTGRTIPAKDAPDAALLPAAFVARLDLARRMLVRTTVQRRGTGQLRSTGDWIPRPVRQTSERQRCRRRQPCVRAPAVVTVRLPADLAAGCELVTHRRAHKPTGQEGSVQLSVVGGRSGERLRTAAQPRAGGCQQGTWTANNRDVAYAAPILVNANSAGTPAIEAAFDDFRHCFPPRCATRRSCRSTKSSR